MTQAELFEPTGAEVGKLVLQHVSYAERERKAAELFETLAMPALAAERRRAVAHHHEQIEVLGMLAEFERLGGVS